MSDLIFLPLSEFDPAMKGEIGCRRMLAEEHDAYVMKHSAHQLAEAKRKAGVRKGLSAAEAPELYEPNFMTSDGLADMLKLSKEIFIDSIKEVRGCEEDSPASLYPTLVLRVRLAIFGRLISSQVPARREVPPT